MKTQTVMAHGFILMFTVSNHFDYYHIQPYQHKPSYGKLLVLFYLYCKTCVKGRLVLFDLYSETCVISYGNSKIDKTNTLMTNGSLMKVESIAECSPWAFCNTFDLH